MRYKTILLLVLSAWGIMACQNYTDKIATSATTSPLCGKIGRAHV